MTLRNTLNPTKHDVAAIAKSSEIVDVSGLTPLEAMRLGLAVQAYQDDNGLTEREFSIDYNQVGSLMSAASKLNRENQ